MNISRTLLPAVLLAGLAATVSLRAGVLISPDIEYFLGDGPGEGLAVSPNGKFLVVSSPVDVGGGFFASSVPHVLNTPAGFVQPYVTGVGAGETTDVAIVPHGLYTLAVVRADAATPDSALLALRGRHVLQRVPIAGSPDGMKVSTDGRYAIVAVEKGGDILIHDLRRGAGHIRLAAVVTQAALAAWFVGVPNPVAALEPEAVAVAPDSSFALVSLQDCASVASLDLDAVTAAQGSGLTPAQIGDLALRQVLHLPYGFVGSNGALFGVDPDGIGIAPDGSFAIVAHEANQRAKHLQSLSVIDLRAGLDAMSFTVHSLFDVDPTLLANTGLAAPPVVNPGDPYPAAANRLPRLDPAAVKIVEVGGVTVAAFVIERYDPSPAQTAASPVNETRGSVLFLDVGDALGGSLPVLGRVPVGVAGARLEVVEAADAPGGKHIYVSISNGGGGDGTFARLHLLED